MGREPLTPGQFISTGGIFATHHPDRVTKWPTVWQEPRSAVIHDGDPIQVPAKVEQITIGPELTAVVGEPLSGASEAEAVEGIKGFTVSNDVTSAGEWPGDCYEDDSLYDGQAFKMLPTFRPTLGSYITMDAGRASDLRIEATVDGEAFVSASTAEMSFSIGEIVSHASEIVPLSEDDLVALGEPTPRGEFVSEDIVGAETVACHVQEIGTITNPVERLG